MPSKRAPRSDYTVDHGELGPASEALKTASPATASRLLEEIVAVWGGAEQIARDLYNEFKALPAQNPQRIRILGLILNAMLRASQHEGVDGEPLEAKERKLKQLLAEYGKSKGDDE